MAVASSLLLLRAHFMQDGSAGLDAAYPADQLGGAVLLQDVEHVGPVEQSEQGHQAGGSVGEHGDASDAVERDFAGDGVLGGERVRGCYPVAAGLVAGCQLGVPGFHFHDLRHNGNTLAAGTGASLADLMARMGHGSTRAAMIYQHATAERDKSIAGALSASIAKERDRARSGHARETKR